MPRLGHKHLLPLAAFIVYFFSNPNPRAYYDYTFRVAENLLHGAIGFADKPPRWLNEFVSVDGYWYSVFPLGSVISMVPFAVLKTMGLVAQMPAALIAAMIAAAICYFLVKISSKYRATARRTILLTAGILLGTWTRTNITFGGAWQLALGFAMAGELGAIYFTVFDRRPFIAGLFFALAFGNRTEVLLTAPIFLYLLCRPDQIEYTKQLHEDESVKRSPLSRLREYIETDRREIVLRAAAFCAVPFVLGVFTLAYNFVRFDSISDFGYARIPGVLNEPWYQHGIFSLYYIPGQAWEMLLKPWELKPWFPYLMPNGFSSSILLSSPFLLFAFRSGARDRTLKYCAWAAIAVLTAVLWMHGNSGGWQFGYRYWMVSLPWLSIILLETSTEKISRFEWAVYLFSIAANAYATFLFHWTSYVRP